MARVQLCSRECPHAKGECDDRVHCPAKAMLHEALRKHFKYTSFRPGQLDALLPVLHGYDVFVRMATGAGKSLCMYLAPLCLGEDAIGMVISPLNSLMEQQVAFLNDVGLKSVHACHADLIPEIVAGNYRFIFMAPETTMQRQWRAIFSQQPLKHHLAMVAIDEAHCILDWGKDFRTSFSRIGGLRALTDAPFMALTASAALEAERSIIQSLGMQEVVHVSRPLDRANIFLSVSPTKGLSKDFAGISSSLSTIDPSEIPKTLVFTQRKDTVCKVYSFLLKSSAKEQYVNMYHASLTKRTKAFVQSRFQSSESDLRVLVATVAFGMGIDISDIERVVYGPPDTVAQLYQLCGRAGRGGHPSQAHLFYTPRQKFTDPVLERYCIDSENCRRIALLEGIGSSEHPRLAVCCDVCSDSIPHPRLNVPGSCSAITRKRRTEKHALDKADLELLTRQLQQERDKIIAEHPGFRMIGINLILSDSAIAEVCKEANFLPVVVTSHYIVDQSSEIG